MIFGDLTLKKVVTPCQDLSDIMPDFAKVLTPCQDLSDFALKTFFGVGSLEDIGGHTIVTPFALYVPPPKT